jgi:hypothetical protein
MGTERPTGAGAEAGVLPIAPLVTQAQDILTRVTALNLAVKKALPTITLYDARELDKIVREAEGWLFGIRKVLLWPTAPPDDETPEGSPPPAPLP